MRTKKASRKFILLTGIADGISGLALFFDNYFSIIVTA
jgi:hypothetical protein